MGPCGSQESPMQTVIGNHPPGNEVLFRSRIREQMRGRDIFVFAGGSMMVHG